MVASSVFRPRMRVQRKKRENTSILSVKFLSSGGRNLTSRNRSQEERRGGGGLEKEEERGDDWTSFEVFFGNILEI